MAGLASVSPATDSVASSGIMEKLCAHKYVPFGCGNEVLQRGKHDGCQRMEGDWGEGGGGGGGGGVREWRRTYPHFLPIILGFADGGVLIPVHVMTHPAQQRGRRDLRQHGTQAGALPAHARKDLALRRVLVPAVPRGECQAGCGLHHHI